LAVAVVAIGAIVGGARITRARLLGPRLRHGSVFLKRSQTAAAIKGAALRRFLVAVHPLWGRAEALC
jgi:hypothetical protein